MRILYLTQWFEPEPNIIKGIGFVRALQAAGHRVTVVTGLPNYPSGRIYPGYRFRLFQRERIGDLEIVRLPLYPSHDRSSLRRSLNFLSFFLSVLAYWLLRRRRFDLAYVYHPPITVGLAAVLGGLVRPTPIILDVQDLWPDTIAATGMTGARGLVGILGALCSFVYRRAAAIVVQSDGMRQTLVSRGVAPSKLSTVHNWARREEAAPSAPAAGPFRLVYAGNLGPAQGLETLVEAAAILQQQAAPVEIAIYGDGIDAASLRQRADGLGLRNLRFMGFVSEEEVTGALGSAHALVLHLADDPLFTITIPSKVQAYLATGKPIVAGVAGEAGRLLNQSGGAIVTAPGNARALAEAIESLWRMSPAQRGAMGRQGRSFYLQRLSFERGVERTLELIDGTYLAMPRPVLPL